jgi:myo-inositol 2-dehydrogenase/D-chiro-inositol 1-dehydrogenase
MDQTLDQALDQERSPLRFAVLGVGRIGRMHARLLAQQVDGAEVACVFDVAPDAAKAVAEELGVAVAPSAEAAISAEGVDAVAICTSTDTHVELMVAAAEAGRAVFCEKPVSLDLEQVDRGLAAVAAAGVPLHIGFNRRFDPGHRAVRDAVAGGAVGELHLVRLTSRDPAPPPISYLRGSGGIFLDMTIHDFDMARFVTGSEITQVYATGGVRVDPAIADAGDLDTAVVVLTHEDGTITTIDNSRQAVYGYDQRVEAFGSGGVAQSENHRVHHAVIRGPEGSRGAPIPYFFLDRYIPSYLAQWRAFVDAVRDGTPVPVGGEAGRAALIAGLAAWESVRRGAPVATAEVA